MIKIKFKKPKIEYDIESYTFNDEVNHNLSNKVYTFTCPCCNVDCKIYVSTDTNIVNNLYTSHYTTSSSPYCHVDDYLRYTDSEWEITDIDEYKEALHNFFNSKEYVRICKESIIKQL